MNGLWRFYFMFLFFLSCENDKKNRAEPPLRLEKKEKKLAKDPLPPAGAFQRNRHDLLLLYYNLEGIYWLPYEPKEPYRNQFEGEDRSAECR